MEKAASIQQAASQMCIRDSTNGETADLMVREGIQITESALKLAGLGAKNRAALLIALANDNQKLAGKTNLKRLIHDGEELTIFSVKQEDLKLSLIHICRAAYSRRTAPCAAQIRANRTAPEN